jgi:2-C-methyl-D-erythritol 4-phosphate cytidylyltransferase
VWAVVVAGGSGTRFGRPKQFDLLAGRTVVEWSVDAARSVADGVVLVLPAQRAKDAESDPAARFGADVVVAGGPSRSASVRLGLEGVPRSADIVVVHDAARPAASPALFAAVVEPLTGPVHAGLPPVERSWEGRATAGVVREGPVAVVCGVPVADTLKRLAGDGTTVAETVDRAALVAVQTPQAFLAQVLRRAHAAGGDATDAAALVEAAGGTVLVVPGEVGNVKIPTPEDLAYIERVVVAGR